MEFHVIVTIFDLLKIHCDISVINARKKWYPCESMRPNFSFAPSEILILSPGSDVKKTRE